ncbi:MAG TPA: hypothetical protein DD435_10925 [Cyanobacteria bacterium UBA8530]|nr:hypothetical protein [Cyanobacteria bacterium UBA8530]
MMKSSIKAIASTLVLSATLAGCAATPGGLQLGSKNDRFSAKSAGAPWAMMNFFALDNDLDNGTGLVSRLHSAATRAASVAVDSLYDGSKNNDSFYIYQSAPGQESKTVQKGEVDSGTAAALGDFVSFAVQNTPAQRRTLTMADHGGGIIRGICSDWTGPGGKKIIHLPEVAAVIEKNPVDFLIFDACFMQMMEVAYEVRKGAKVLLAAQTTTRGDYPYETMVNTLNSNAAADTKVIATKLLSVIADNARYESAFGAVETSKTEEVAKRMNKLSTILIEKAKDKAMRKSLQNALRNSMGYANETEAGLLMYNNYRDMVDVMTNLAKISDPAIQEAARSVAEATKASVLGESHRNGGFFGGTNLDKASGIALYAQVDGPVEAKYLSRSWNKDTRWGDALAQINTTGWAPAIQADKFPLSFPKRK